MLDISFLLRKVITISTGKMSKKNKIFEFGMLFGDYYWKMGELKQTKEGKEVYFAIPIPHVGLHLSFHESGEMHLKDKFGFEERLNLINLYNSKEEIISDFSSVLYHPKHDEEVIVMSTTIPYTGLEDYGLYLGDKEVQIEFLKFFNAIEFSEPQLKKALLLPKKTFENLYIALDCEANKLIFP